MELESDTVKQPQQASTSKAALFMNANKHLFQERLDSSERKKTNSGDAVDRKCKQKSKVHKAKKGRRRRHDEVPHLDELTESAGKPSSPSARNSHERNSTDNGPVFNNPDRTSKAKRVESENTTFYTPIVTPPYSSTKEKSAHRPFFTLEPSSESISNGSEQTRAPANCELRSSGLKRKGIPSALNMDAINLDRQFSGPFSANPLLRNHEQDNKSPNSKSGNDENPNSENNTASHLTPKEPTTANESLQTPPRYDSARPVKLPLISEMVTAAYMSPSRVSAPVSIISPRSSNRLTSGPPPAWVPSNCNVRTPTRDGFNRENVLKDLLNNVTSRESSISSNSASHDVKLKDLRKRERFLQLCGEMWDLVREE